MKYQQLAKHNVKSTIPPFLGTTLANRVLNKLIKLYSIGIPLSTIEST